MIRILVIRPRGPGAERTVPPAALLGAFAGAVACLFGVLTWQVVAAGPLTEADMPVHRWVVRHGLDRSSPLWVLLEYLGAHRALPVLAIVAAVTWWRRRALRPLLLAAAGFAVFTVVFEVTKEEIGRAPPSTGNVAAFAGGDQFPSGHASAATVIWGLATWLGMVAARRTSARRVSRYACLIAGGTVGVATAAAMVRMDYHWLSDVAGGWLLGMSTLLAVLAAAESRPGRAQRSGGPLHRSDRRPGPPRIRPGDAEHARYQPTAPRSRRAVISPAVSPGRAKHRFHAWRHGARAVAARRWGWRPDLGAARAPRVGTALASSLSDPGFRSFRNTARPPDTLLTVPRGSPRGWQAQPQRRTGRNPGSP